MTSAQKKKVIMVVLGVTAILLLGYQLAPVIGLTKPNWGSSEEKNSSPSPPSQASAPPAPATAEPSKPSIILHGKEGSRPMAVPQPTSQSPTGKRIDSRLFIDQLTNMRFSYEAESQDVRNPFENLTERRKAGTLKPYQPEAKLDGILWNESHPVAIFNGKFYRVGQSFDGIGKIVEVGRGYVVVSNGRDSVTFFMKDKLKTFIPEESPNGNPSKAEKGSSQPSSGRDHPEATDRNPPAPEKGSSPSSSATPPLSETALGLPVEGVP